MRFAKLLGPKIADEPEMARSKVDWTGEAKHGLVNGTFPTLKSVLTVFIQARSRHGLSSFLGTK